VGQTVRSLLQQSLRNWGLALATTGLVAASALTLAPLSWAKQPAAEVQTVQLATLPPEARSTERLIRAGGPFPHEKDGSVFGNRERLLPARPRGYYREYTVPTPGASNRGARRIVCGGSPPTHPESCYYTADHYATFRLIVQ
jgi:ribonuclease T1